MSRYEFKNSKQCFSRCCNPFYIENHNPPSRNLRVVSSSAVEMFCHIRKDDRICDPCRKKIQVIIKESSIPKSIETLPMEVCEDVDENKMLLDNYDKDALIHDFLAAKNPLDLVHVLPPSLIVHSIKFFQSIVDKINDRLVNKVQKIQLLTLFSLTMGVAEMKKYLNVSEHHIVQSQSLLTSKGILAVPNKKKGKELPPQVTDYIIDFYQRDDISSARPSMRDIIKIKQSDGTTLEVKKRLLHWNLKEAFEILKNELLNRPNLNYHVGLTKFTLLRPKNVLLVSANGTHNVCVCALHQNVKLSIQGAHLGNLTKNGNVIIDSYRKCFALILCNNATEDCYLLKCNQCPGKQILVDYLMDIFEQKEVETVTIKQWRTDKNKTTLGTLQYDYDEFVDYFAEQVEGLIGHAFIVDQQSKFSRDIENNLKDGEFKVVSDFAENSSYVVQNAIQGFHWNNDQATLYNVVIYYRENGHLQHRSIVIVSENRKHDAISVYTFTKIIVDYLKKEFSSVKKIYYFSDGAPQQYKNYKNVINLAYHKTDFGIEAEWHFYPTSHGKGPCDGLGASVKHGTRCYCLQSKGDNQILNCDDLYKWLSTTDRFPNVVFKYSSTVDYNKSEKFLNRRFQNSNRIEHLQDQHCLIPLENGSIRVKRFSYSNTHTDQKIL